MAARRKRKQVEPPASVPLVYFKGVGLALAITVAVVLAVTIIAAATAVSERVATWLLVFGVVGAVLAGSIYTGRRLGRAGLLSGGIVGFAYSLLLTALALLLDVGVGARVLATLAASFALGAAGGIVGVNSR